MKRQSAHLFVVAVLALLGPLAAKGRGDFILWNDEWLTVNSSHSQGLLYDTSCAFIVSGGAVTYLYAYDSGAVGVSGGNVSWLRAYNSSTTNISVGNVGNLYAYDISTVNISGGTVGGLQTHDSSDVDISGGSMINQPLYAYDSSTVSISGGSVNYLYASYSSTVDVSSGYVYQLYTSDISTVNISGGTVGNLHAYNSSTVSISSASITNLDARNSSTVTFYGQNFRVGGELAFDGERVLGTGMLSGEWMDGTRWAVNISTNEPTATILAIPAPYILTIDVDPNDVGIDTITPSVGPHDYARGWVSIKAERFINCPDVYTFDHWDGDVNDPNSADTTVFMDSDKTITAVFVDGRQCGDECHPYPSGDVNKDCKVDFLDIAMVASSWLECTKPECD